MAIIDLSPKRQAVLSRIIKVTAYQVLAAVLVNAAALAGFVFLKFHLDPTTVTLASFLVTSVAAGIHKGINWQEVGIQDPGIPQTPPVKSGTIR